MARITPENAPITVVDKASLWLLSRQIKFKFSGAATVEFKENAELEFNVDEVAEEG